MVPSVDDDGRDNGHNHECKDQNQIDGESIVSNLDKTSNWKTLATELHAGVSDSIITVDHYVLHHLDFQVVLHVHNNPHRAQVVQTMAHHL